MQKLKVINLFAGPCSGKSTTASGLFYDMKRAGHSVELVTEYAKDMVWESRHNILADQQYVLAKQHRRVARLVGQVEYAITDSPLPLGLVYKLEGYPASFQAFLCDIFEQYDNRNFFLQRNCDLEYQQTGRTQGLSEAMGVDERILTLLHELNLDFTLLRPRDGDFKDQIAKDLGLCTPQYLQRTQGSPRPVCGLVAH